MQNKTYLFYLWLILLVSCGSNQTKKEPVSDSAQHSTLVKTSSVQPDSFKLTGSFNEEDLPVNDYLTERLKPIRANYKRINSIVNWTTIKTKALDETTEGGQARFYSINGKLEKITTHRYGETFQNLTEYYLLNGHLSFVLAKSYNYNRPLQYDSAEMNAMKDNEAFELEKAEIVEDRSYFEHGKLIHQLNNQDCGAPFDKRYLESENQRITTDFNILRELANTK